MPPDQAAGIATTNLIARPFFAPFDNDLHWDVSLWQVPGTHNQLLYHVGRWMYQPEGDPSVMNRLSFLPPQPGDMKKMQVHAKLIAEMIPPLSSPAGGVPLKKLVIMGGGRSNNLNVLPYKNATLWDSAKRPKKSDKQREEQRWLHGDYKDAPYLLTCQLYKQIKGITQGEPQ